MKNKILTAVIGAALVAPGAAFADPANLKISGFLKTGLNVYKLSGGTAASYDNEIRIDDQQSRLIFSGTEDLGGGVKAFFQIDNRISSDLGAGGLPYGLASGNTGVGVQGGFGKVTIGRWDLHFVELTHIESNRAGSLQSIQSIGPVAQVNGTTLALGSRTDNLVMYDSADFAGFTIRAAYSVNVRGNEGSGKGGDNSKDGAYNLVVRYAAGPLEGGASLWNLKAEGLADSVALPGGAAGTGGDQEALRAWVGFTYPSGLRVGFGYDHSEVRLAAGAGLTGRDAFVVPVAYAFGASTAYLTFSKMDEADGPAGTLADTGAEAVTVGFDRALSKRTSVGAFYTKLTNDPAATYNLFGCIATTTLCSGTASVVSAGEDSKQIYLGVLHTF